MRTQRVIAFAIAPLLISIFLVPTEAGAAGGPANISSGLALWLDASDPDGDGVSANNPSDGALVSTWSDKSGSGNNARVLSGQGTPRYARTSTVSSLPAMRFVRTSDTVGQVFEVPGVDIRAGANEDVTIFTVYRANYVAGGGLYGVWGQDNGAWDRFAICCGYPSSGNDGVVGLGPGSGGAIVYNAGVGTRILTTVYNGAISGGTNAGPTNGSAVYFDGNLIQRFTDSTNSTDAQSTFRIGFDGDGSTFNGDIAELITYNRVLSDTEIQQVSNYLAGKYALTISLAPTVTTQSASAITSTTATLNALVNANSQTTSALTLKYSTSSATVLSDGGTSASPSPTSATGSSDTQISAAISGLTPGQTYYFRASATNSVGGPIFGNVLSFTAPLYSTTTNVTFAAGGSVTYRIVNRITATVSTPGKVSFLANGKRIPGCKDLTATTSAFCDWRPSSHGTALISVNLAPTTPTYAASTWSNRIGIEKRITKR